MADKKFIEEFMSATNFYRNRHRVDELSYNPEIAKISQAWADKLTGYREIRHQRGPLYRGELLGENISVMYSSRNNYYSGYEAVGQFYTEVVNYNFRSATGSGTGHFTQLVWKDTKEVGVGKAQNPNGKWIVVANYFPAGNLIRNYAENVFPPINNNVSLYDPTASGCSFFRVESKSRMNFMCCLEYEFTDNVQKVK